MHSGRDVTLRAKWKDGDVETVSSGTSTVAHPCAASLPCARPDEVGARALCMRRCETSASRSISALLISRKAIGLG